MVPDRNVPFGQALVVYPVPVAVASAAKNEGK
jgi:hypothetical protein